MPPVLNIIRACYFSRRASRRGALDPVLPHVADEFGVEHHPPQQALQPCFGLHLRDRASRCSGRRPICSARRGLMIVCLVLLGCANILGAMSTVVFGAVRDGGFSGRPIGSGGVFSDRA